MCANFLVRYVKELWVLQQIRHNYIYIGLDRLTKSRNDKNRHQIA